MSANSKKRNSPLDYPVTIKQHLDFVVFQVPDLGVTVVEQAPTDGKLTPKYINRVAKSLAKTWLKSSERLQQFQLAEKKPPNPSRQKRPIEEKKERQYTTPEVADYLGVSENTIRRLVKRRELDCNFTPRGHRRFTEIQVQTYLKKQKQKAQSKSLS